MSDGIIDSAILIDYLRGHADAVDFIATLSGSSTVRSHLLVAAELIAGVRDKRELKIVDELLSEMDIFLPTEADAEKALHWFRAFRLSHGVDWPDCQIAATALRLGLPVVTMNTKHFAAFPGLQVSRPY